MILILQPAYVNAEKIINLNSAAQEELMSMLNIDKFKAIEIIKYRNSSGGFRDINELAMILKPEHVERRMKHIKIYAVPEYVWKTKDAQKDSHLQPEKMLIKVFPLDGYSAYVVFPDGGNMLIDTGKRVDSEKLVSYIKQEIGQGKESKIMGALGWKPRIDWLVITDYKVERCGGFENVLENFKVKNIVTMLRSEDYSKAASLRRQLNSYLTFDSNHINYSRDSSIDIQQTVSNVKVNIIGPQYFENNEKLGIKISYEDFSFVIMPELTETIVNKINHDIYETQKRIFLLANEPEGNILAQFDEGNFMDLDQSHALMTDGHLLYSAHTLEDTLKTSIPVVISEKKENSLKKLIEREIKERYNHAMRLYRMQEFENTIKECDRILDINRDHEAASALKDKAKNKLAAEKAIE
jgi:hypothetical protein